MAVRVKLRIKSRLEAGVEVETVALVNSGFEADAPEIVIPMRLAERLNLRSRLLEARVEPYNTVVGPIRMYVLPSSIEVEVVEEDNRSPTVVCDAVISDRGRSTHKRLPSRSSWNSSGGFQRWHMEVEVRPPDQAEEDV